MSPARISGPRIRGLAALLCAVVGATSAGASFAAVAPGWGAASAGQARADDTAEQLVVLVRAGVEYETIRLWLEARGGAPVLSAADLAIVRDAGASVELLTLLGADTSTGTQPSSTRQLDPEMPVATFSSRVELVRVSVVVLDDRGEYVRGLAVEDFALWEEGREQHVASLIEVDAPVSVGLLVDTSGSMSNKRDEADDALEHFFRTLQASDDIFVLGFSGRPELLIPATTDRKRLDQSRRLLRMNGATSLHDAVIAGLQILEEAVAEKRALVVITDGVDNSSHADMDDALELARRSEVAIYTVGIGHRTESFRGGDRHGSSREPDFDERTLRALAEATGGRAHLLIGDDHHHGGENDRLRDAAVAIATSLNHEYLLLYTPSDPAAAGEWRKIRVEVTRKGYQVRARPGYTGSGSS